MGYASSTLAYLSGQPDSHGASRENQLQGDYLFLQYHPQSCKTTPPPHLQMKLIHDTSQTQDNYQIFHKFSRTFRKGRRSRNLVAGSLAVKGDSMFFLDEIIDAGENELKSPFDDRRKAPFYLDPENNLIFPTGTRKNCFEI